ncbi:hypothetical protein C8J56DRAFT_1159835 [Mycena floridula]|nr:hypothetical protein C8J56DRAFT_1159835 [Mycena floridula]
MSQDPEKGKAQGAYTQSPTMPSNADAAERRLWALYSEESAKYDKGLALNWKGDMDAILIFAGLFTASVTAMIVESYKLLKPDSGDQTVALLTQLSQQLAHLSDSTLPAPQLITNDNPFHPATSVVICNFLFFLSLGFTLLCAVGATLVEQWVRQYLQETQAGTPIQNARLREYLHQGIVHFRMLEVVETIPFLLHISLFLFFAGLCIFIYPFNHIIGALCMFIFAICFVLYLIPTLTPIFIRFCPYKTPLTTIFWRVCQIISVSLQRFPPFKRIWQRQEGSLAVARLSAATSNSSSRKERDYDAISWLISSRMDDVGIEAMCEVLPLICARNFNNYHELLFRLLDDRVMLGDRIVGILNDASQKHLQGAQMLQRSTTCLEALRSILHVSFMDRWRGCFVPDRLGSRTCFNLTNTLRGLQYPGPDLDLVIPSTQAYVWCQVITELRRQITQITSAAAFTDFVTRSMIFFNFYDDSELSSSGEKVFCSLFRKLVSIREYLRSSAEANPTSDNWSERKQNLLEKTDDALRTIMVDYIISAFISGTQGSRHEFLDTASEVLWMYREISSSRDKSVWLKVTSDSLTAIEGVVDTGALLKNLEVMSTRPDLASTFTTPLKLVLNALRAVSCGPDLSPKPTFSYRVTLCDSFH